MKGNKVFDVLNIHLEITLYGLTNLLKIVNLVCFFLSESKWYRLRHKLFLKVSDGDALSCFFKAKEVQHNCAPKNYFSAGPAFLIILGRQLCQIRNFCLFAQREDTQNT